MSDIKAVPYRTPACEKHLPNNEDDVCPWCRIAELESDLAGCIKLIAKYEAERNE